MLRSLGVGVLLIMFQVFSYLSLFSESSATITTHKENLVMMHSKAVRFDGVELHEGGVRSSDLSTEDIFGLIIQAALVTVFIWSVVSLVNLVVKYMSAKTSLDNMAPLDMVKKRLASGEITNSQYEELKKRLI